MANGELNHPYSIIRVLQLAKFKKAIEGIFVKAANIFSISKTTSEDGDDTITTYTIS